MSRMEAYVSKWESRCYSEGIPDEVSYTLEKSHRVPSYRAIAICILKNDLMLTGLGFSGEYSKWSRVLKEEKEKRESNQLDLL